MIIGESEDCHRRHFDVAIVAVGYERRCTFVTEKSSIEAAHFIGLLFGFLEDGAFAANKSYFESKEAEFLMGTGEAPLVPELISKSILNLAEQKDVLSVFVDVSAMSRQVMSNVALALQIVSLTYRVEVCTSYAPSIFHKDYAASPITYEGPINHGLAGWSSHPETPLGVIFGLGCEENLVLGALQFLEPDKGWLFCPRGVEGSYDAALEKANQHVSDIFDVTYFGYDIRHPAITRSKYQVLLNSLTSHYRVITVPFGPKIFSWLTMSTVIFDRKHEVGLWTFSSRDKARLVDRDAEGTIIWHVLTIDSKSQDTRL